MMVPAKKCGIKLKKRQLYQMDQVKYLTTYNNMEIQSTAIWKKSQKKPLET